MRPDGTGMFVPLMTTCGNVSKWKDDGRHTYLQARDIRCLTCMYGCSNEETNGWGQDSNRIAGKAKQDSGGMRDFPHGTALRSLEWS